MCGRIRPSQRGTQNACLPKTVSSAGASRTTINPASKTAEASPTPNCLIVGSSVRMKLPNTAIMMMAAATITRALGRNDHPKDNHYMCVNTGHRLVELPVGGSARMTA